MSADVTIVTGMGPGLGQGHVQRMASLLSRLRDAHGLDVMMVIHPRVGEVPSEAHRHERREVGETRLILRDMRDSTEEQVSVLRSIAPVCVIDDRGPGRELADHVLDILPHPDPPGVKAVAGSFIYGCNFLQSLKSLDGRIVKKSVDFVVYAGAVPDDAGAEKLLSLLPVGASWYLLGRGAPLFRDGRGEVEPARAGYAEILLSSRVAVTHFGLFLYEASVSGCGVVAVNPTAYHSGLADCISHKKDLTNLGVFGDLDDTSATEKLRSALERASIREVDGGETARRVQESIDRCADLVAAML
ncbi:MAG: hypothetical protein KBA61_00350 [Spirochaetes bacterium]|nr:hypothetical protein [Spirochaetota bacterium]